MKPLSRILFFTSILILLSLCPAVAQKKQSQDSDLLRANIERFEKTNLNSKSTSVQSIYQRTLLRLYHDFKEALQQDIADLKTMQSAVGGTNSDSQKEIALQIQKLTQELYDVSEKMQTLSGDLQTASAPPPSSAPADASLPLTQAIYTSGRARAVTAEPVSGTTAMSTNQPTAAATVLNIGVTDAIPQQGGAGAAPIPTPPPNLLAASLREGSTMISGITTDHGKKVGIKLNGEDMGSVSSDGVNGYFAKSVRELKEDDIVEVRELNDDGTDASAPRIYRIRADEINLRKGGPVGLLVGGAVFSQQGDQFNQSDPFFGFIAGYSSYVHGGRNYPRNFDGNPLDSDGNIMHKCTEEDASMFGCNKDAYYVLTLNRQGDQLVFKKDSSGNLVLAKPGFKQADKWRWNVRFQGIFTADGRTAQATETANSSTGTTTGGSTGTGTGASNPADNIKFIASRKTFNVETHAWIDFFPLNLLSIGPYAAWGASTVMDKNELANEPTRVSPSSSSTSTTGTTTGTGGTTTGTSTTGTATTVTQAISDDDIKQYQEAGMLMNLLLFNKKLFVQSILGYGHYEALRDLHGEGQHGFGDDSTQRFIGKLRVFPGGLKTSFGKQFDAAPMFGVDLNAGPGPDYLKFFVGYAIRVGGIKGVPGLQ